MDENRPSIYLSQYESNFDSLLFDTPQPPSQLESTAKKLEEDSLEGSFKIPGDDDIILDSKKVTK
jgi:predicted transposase YdaD